MATEAEFLAALHTSRFYLSTMRAVMQPNGRALRYPPLVDIVETLGRGVGYRLVAENRDGTSLHEVIWPAGADIEAGHARIVADGRNVAVPLGDDDAAVASRDALAVLETTGIDLSDVKPGAKRAEIVAVAKARIEARR